MPARRGDRVAPPAGPGQWEVVFGTNDAAKGWENLCTQAAANTRTAWQAMCADPQPQISTQRHHRLKGSLSHGSVRGVDARLPQWQYEVTGSGRIWYLVHEERRRVIVMHAGPGHPKATD
jgi:hypothetical protein